MESRCTHSGRRCTVVHLVAVERVGAESRPLIYDGPMYTISTWVELSDIRPDHRYLLEKCKGGRGRDDLCDRRRWRRLLFVLLFFVLHYFVGSLRVRENIDEERCWLCGDHVHG